MKKINMNTQQKQQLTEAYKSLVSYRKALSEAYLNGQVPLEVRSKADLFHTVNAIERLLTTGQIDEFDMTTIDKECGTLDLICQIYPTAFEYVLPELEAVGKAFEALEGFTTH